MAADREYNLGFISDEDIKRLVYETIGKYRIGINLSTFNSNVIDPIKLTFDSFVYNKTIEEIVESECLRQIDKSNTNVIGSFHQNIFRYADSSWEVPKVGYDLINQTHHIYAEIKNKHNAMNAASSQRTYIKMQHTLLEDDESTCYLVEVISKVSADRTWCISLDGKQMSNRNIRRISMDKFYGIVFGDPIAFYKLCNKLPQIVEDVVKETEVVRLTNSVFTELKELDSNVLKSLYLLAFKNYEGFQ